MNFIIDLAGALLFFVMLLAFAIYDSGRRRRNQKTKLSKELRDPRNWRPGSNGLSNRKKND